MLSKLSAKITLAFINSGQIDEGERELYEYGFFILLSNLLFFAVVLVTGILCGKILQGILFFIAFRCIRQYAGGHHAKTELRCQVLSSAAIICSILIIKGLEAISLPWLAVIPAAIGTVSVLLFAPLDTPEKPLSPAEQKHFRKIAYIILLILDLSFIVGFVLHVSLLIYPIGVALGLEAVLLCFGKAYAHHAQKKISMYERAE